ncbi:MAG: PQQ-dependent sugar dehydrogenase [Chthoniobacterales bacterium]
MTRRFSIGVAFVGCVLLFCSANIAPAATVNVQVGPDGSMSYSPDPVNIHPGDTVHWIWASSNHSVTSSTAGESYDSDVHNPTFTFDHTFNSTGSFDYFCKFHGQAFMNGTVVVAADSTPTPTPTPSATPTPTATPSPTPTSTPTPSATPTATPILPRVQTGPIRIELQTVASGLQAPVDLVSINDNSTRIVIVQQRGKVVLLKNGHVAATPFLDVSARLVQFDSAHPDAIPGPHYDERGLLGIAFHPDFADSSKPGFRKLYTFTNEPVSGTADFTVPMTGAFDNQVVIAEWKVSASNPDVVDPATRREILRIDHPQFNHNGGQIAFKPGEPYLYISIGDGGAANDVGPGHNPATGNGQDTTTVLGKVLRIDPVDPALTAASNDPVSTNGKYRIPASNPFIAHSPSAVPVREIYAFGFRNPYRFSFDQPSGKLVLADVGQDHVEEVDIVESGKNYGWHLKEGTFLFDPANGNVAKDPAPDPDLTNPIAQYDHESGIAVVGGFIYHGSELPALDGMYVFGDFTSAFTKADGHLFYLDKLNGGTIRKLRIGFDERDLGRCVKAFGRDAAGEIYVLADSSLGPSGNGGIVYKLVQAPPTPALLNLSTRMDVLTNDNVLIGGFIVVGSAPKAMILRALGPSLTFNGQPIAGRMQNPTLELHDSTGKLIDSNDDWQSSAQKQEFIDRDIAPPDSRESALFDSLQPGAYTAILRGANGDTGIGLVELFDVDQAASANPANISTRGFVQTDDNVMIGGFIIGGTGQKRVLVRAIGPSLTGQGVTGALQDPMLELHDKDGALLLSNDNWKSPQQAEIEATGIPPSDDRESAIVTNLGPSNYTAIVRGANNSTGVALVEVFQLPQ